jgi:adenosine kinase
MKNIVVTGSIAYDHLMSFDGEFADSLIADQLRNLSVSFLASTHDHEFGGCAGNIAYSLKQLSCEPIILGVAGGDFEKYRAWLEKHSISTDQIFIDEHKDTASAYVLTDKTQSQISIFSPGAMGNLEDGLELKGVDPSTVACAIVAPEPPKRMLSFGRYFKRIGVPFVFDPGQAIPSLTKEDVLELIDESVGMIANEYEVEMLAKKLEIPVEKLADLCKFLIKTTGEKGCEIYEKGNVIKVPAISGLKVVDATGCGDAFRAGFLSGYVKGMSLEKACALGNKIAALVIVKKGTQSHKITSADLSV